MYDKKVGIISQARMTSTRLPGKILKKVNGITLLECHIQRLKAANALCIIATTDNVADDPVIELCGRLGVPTYRGSENDVLERYYKTAQEYSLDVIVRVTSDCPLIDGHLVEKGIQDYLAANDDLLYLSNCLERTFPRGMDFEIFSFLMLEAAYKEAKDPAEREHVTPFIWRNKQGRFHLKSILNEKNDSQYRLTVDETADFELIEKLLAEFNLWQSSTLDIVRVLEGNPLLKKINESIEQKKV